ncbi:MAG: zinc-dependent metalloprotease [Gemmatimonadetes bacterium]|nr:zinc-dependent metalloprotease [Gemmatimonadota bacterium]
MSRLAALCCVVALLCPAVASAQRAMPSISEGAEGFVRREGFVPILVNADLDRVRLEVPREGMQALFLVSLASGAGSNPLGLDRGADGRTEVVRLERAGSRMLVIFENTAYRSSGDSLHRRTVTESFARSTVAALPIVAEEGDRVLVDATELVMRDWNDVIGTLRGRGEGSYGVARDRSRIRLDRTRAFPDNAEIDVELAFTTSGAPGRVLRQVSPEGTAISLRQHLTFLRLPDDSYAPRDWDPRTGYFPVRSRDYFQPLQERLERHVIARHRLQRRDPSDPASPFIEPIVYYLDPGIPEPVRTATWEGARWWEEAFAAAGLAGGFRVEWLPADADPMDARYNVVQWENRNERGWSIGGSLSDPRTGEILKGMARMDSHRARTDYNLFAALMGAAPTPADTAFILARIRQVTAHEIGHTLGLAHNYIASTYDRGSVMDYPAPRARVVDGQIDLSAAYDRGPGAFDIWAIRWGYGIFPPAVEADSLTAILREGVARGWLFLSDGDARPANAADPRTNLWDDASSAEEFLARQLEVRRVAMARFGLDNIRPGEPVALLQERFAPLYFWHRYAVAAVAKAVGGLSYQYAVSGDGQQAVRPLPQAAQRAALAALSRTLEPGVLTIPDTILALMPPRPAAWSDPTELFRSATAPMFDELGAAETLARLVIDAVLQPERLARVRTMAAHDPNAITVDEIIEVLERQASARRGDDRHAEALRRITQRALVDRLLALSTDDGVVSAVRDAVDLRLDLLLGAARQRATGAGSPEVRAHWRGIARDIERWLVDGERPTVTDPLPAPPFDPFGEDPDEALSILP